MSKTTTEDILDVAERWFAERGYEATSLGDIADGVGIRTPSLYKHFDNKEELFIAVLERLLDPFFEILHRILVVAWDQEQAEKNLRTVVRYYFGKPNLARLIQHISLAGGRHAEMLQERWLVSFMQRAAELSVPNPFLKGRDSSDFLLLVIAFFNMIVGYITLAPLTGKLIGSDPLSPEALKRQEEFLMNLVRFLHANTHGDQ